MKTFSEAEVADWVAVSRIMVDDAPNHELIDRLCQCLDIIAHLQAREKALREALVSMVDHFGPLEDNPFFNDDVRRAFRLSRAALEGK